MATFRDLANLQHGPSKATMNMNAPMKGDQRPAAGKKKRITEVKCPQCTSLLEIHTNVESGNVAGKSRIVKRVAMCSGCEFVHEF